MEKLFYVIPVMVALLVGAYKARPTNVVKVNARGMGFEHEQPRKRSSLFASPLAAASAVLARLRSQFAGIQRHAVFGPGLAALTVLIAFLISPAALLAGPVMFGALTEKQHAGAFILHEAPSYASRGAVTVLSGQNLVAGAVCGRVTLGIGGISVPAVAGGTGTGTASLVFAGPEVEVGSYVLTCITAVTNGGVWTLTTPSGKSLPNFTQTVGSTTATVYTSRHINFTITDATDFIVGNTFTFVVSTTAPTVVGGTGTGVLTALTLGRAAKPGRYKINNDVVVTNGGDMTITGPDGDMVGGRFIWAAAGSTATFTSRQISFTISDATDYIANNYFEVCVFNQLAGGKAVAWDPTTFDGRHRVAGILFDDVNASTADKAGVLVDMNAVIAKTSLSWAAAITSSQKESAYLDMLKLGIRARD